jgi:colicin import membrane protein
MRTLLLTTAAFAALVMIAPVGAAHAECLQPTRPAEDAGTDAKIRWNMYVDALHTVHDDELDLQDAQAADRLTKVDKIESKLSWDRGMLDSATRAAMKGCLDAKAEADARAAVVAKAEADARAKADAEALADRPRIEAEAKAKVAAEQAEIEGAAKAKMRIQIEGELRAKAEADAKAKAEADAKAEIEAATKAKDEASAEAAKAAVARAEADAIARHDDQVRQAKEADEAIERARVEGVRRLKDAKEAVAQQAALRVKSIEANMAGQPNGALIGWCLNQPGPNTDEITTHDAACNELHHRGIHSTSRFDMTTNRSVQINF